jgi:hypothetical protein
VEEQGGPRRDETEAERLDRNFNELLQELRVSQTGVQILFAFLLTLPFTQRFNEVSAFERDVYFVTLVLAGAASAFFIGPVSYHRLLFRKKEKGQVVFVANWMALGGLACLALAITGVILLITHFLFGQLTAIIVTGCIATLIGVLWYTLPLARLLRDRREER